MMENARIELVIEALEPIAHASETLGNSQIAMRQKIRQPDGTFAAVPIITGDTMRHGLREAGSYALLSAAGLLGEHLSESALRLLFSGGMVTGAGGSIRLDEYREWMELVPPLALLGGCAQNRVIPGQLDVSAAILICRETEDALPEWVREWLEERKVEIAAARQHVEEVQRVRMDPTLSPEKRKLLTELERSAVEGRLLASETASETQDAVGKSETKSSMMPFRYETIAQGSLFFWRVEARLFSAIDRDTFLTLLACFLRDSRVGGKKGTGHGRIRPIVARNIEVLPFHEKTSALALTGETNAIGTLFREHVSERKERLKDFLSRVKA